MRIQKEFVQRAHLEHIKMKKDNQHVLHVKREHIRPVVIVEGLVNLYVMENVKLVIHLQKDPIVQRIAVSVAYILAFWRTLLHPAYIIFPQVTATKDSTEASACGLRVRRIRIIAKKYRSHA
jgi:hypothetical protein